MDGAEQERAGFAGADGEALAAGLMDSSKSDSTWFGLTMAGSAPGLTDLTMEAVRGRFVERKSERV